MSGLDDDFDDDNFEEDAMPNWQTTPKPNP